MGHYKDANWKDDYEFSLPSFIKGRTTTTFKVAAKHDEIVEGHEEFALIVSGESIQSHAPINLIIIDDDGSNQTLKCVTLTASDYTPDEGDTVTITATLDEAAGQTGVEIPLSVASQSSASDAVLHSVV